MRATITATAAAWATALLAVATLGQDATAQTAPAMESYQTEIRLGYQWRDIDTNPDIELTDVLLEGTYNLEPVSLKGHPWNEAAFLEHSMQAMVELSWSEFEISTFDADGLVYGGGFRYATKDCPIAADLVFKTGSLDGDMSFDVDLTTIDASVGYWVEPHAIAGVTFNYTELDPDGTFKIEQKTIAAFGKMVHKLDDERAINAEARVGWTRFDSGTSDDDNVVLTLEGDYYFTPQYSAGGLVDFSFGSSDADEGLTLGVRASAWFTPQVGVMVELSRFWADDSSGADEDQAGFFVSIRF